ncbi:MAG: hypothetical protein J6W42_02135 [Bacteroidaceae bacterium]|nr:hypothetical protein [Bacteroidaceae bacterium]
MKRKLHILLFLLALFCASAVSSDVMAQDYMEPSDRFTVNDKDGKYQDKYGNERILSLFPEEWSIGYLASPSLSGQYGIFLIWDDDGPMLVYNRFKSNYSVSRRERSKKEENIKVSSDTVRISTEEADRLTGIITDAIDKAVKPNGLDRLVFDGTTYFFMLPDKMAKTCSPEKNTNCYNLVEEFENLKKLFGDEPFMELS